jgi:hypothetical protein
LGRREFEVVLAALDPSEQAILRIEVLGEVISAQLDACLLPPGVEGIDVWIAADSVSDQLLPPVGTPLSALG